MTDCSNVTMREMLPDLANGRLGAEARAEVESHVASCAECRAELELLHRVRAATPTPKVDTGRIVAAIPSYRRASLLVRASRSWTVRAAAAVVLVVGGATLLRSGGSTFDEPDTLLASASAAGLPVAGLADVQDQDLKALVAELGKIQAVTPVEPEVVVPAVGRGSGGGQ